MGMPIHYRIRDELHPDGVKVFAEVWAPIKETPKGYWVEHFRYSSPYWWSFAEKRKAKLVKWVSKCAARRYCYPELSDAIASYHKRKASQVDRLKLQLEQAEIALAAIPGLRTKDVETLTSGTYVGIPESMTPFHFLDY